MFIIIIVIIIVVVVIIDAYAKIKAHTNQEQLYHYYELLLFL